MYKKGFWHSREVENNKGKMVLESGGRTKEYRLNALRNEGESYFENLMCSNGKPIISLEEIMIANECVNGILNTPKLRNIVESAEKQYAIYWTYTLDGYDLDSKALLDFAIITENTIRVIDLKCTTAPLHDVEKMIKKLRWDGQLAWYSLALQSKFPNHKLLSPQLIVSSTTEPNNPQLITLSDRDWDIALNGAQFNKSNKVVNHTYLNTYLERKQPINGIKQAIDSWSGYLQGNKFTITETKLWDGI